MVIGDEFVVFLPKSSLGDDEASSENFSDKDKNWSTFVVDQDAGSVRIMNKLV